MGRTSTVEHSRRAEGPARLVVLAGPQAGQRRELHERGTIGRSADSLIVLEDAGVSRKHAEVHRREDGGWEIADLASRNGVRVNGSPVQRSELFIGDKIQLGPNVLLLFTDRSAVEGGLIERQKLELLGRVAAGIAHDFNNVLGVLGASAAYLHDAGATADPAEAQACVEDMQAAIANGARLANRLVGFARGSPQGRSVVDVSAICREIAQMCRRFFGAAVRIELEIQPALSVLADEGELEQVLLNLCVNARDAMPSGGTLLLRAARRSPAELGEKGLAFSVPQVVLTVEDTGTGIEPRHLSRIFEPFFTTKSVSAGSGVGLATVKELVTLHGGAIDVESERGRGTSFHVCLPLVEPSRKSRAMTFEATPTHTHGEGRRVLVVDDDELVRRSTKRLLVRAGFEVLEASSGLEALSIYARGPRPALVLLDLEMRGLGGLEVLAELRKLDPSVRVLVVSGHREPLTEQAVREGGAWFLGKPFASPDLLDAARIALIDASCFADNEATTQ